MSSFGASFDPKAHRGRMCALPTAYALRVSRPPKRSSRRLPLVQRSPYTPDVLAGIAEGERKVVAHVLGTARGAEAALTMAELASERAADLTSAARMRNPPPAPIACKEGCSWCCSSKVLVLAPEVLRIADYLRGALTPEARDRLIARVDDVHRQTIGMTRAERAQARISCPLLEERRCTIHSVRPLVCAGWTSLDAMDCERYWQAPGDRPSAPVYPAQYEIANAVMAGVSRGLADAGLEGRPLELVAALRIALTRGNAPERWARGLPVFSQAVDAELASTSGTAAERG
jgi:hypothetical protein